MRFVLAAAAALLALVPFAAAASVRSVATPAPVLALAADGSRIVFATGRSARDCNRVLVWNLATRVVTRLGRKTHCEQTSTGNAVAAVSIAGTRVLWTYYVGGNFREWSLWTATTSRLSPTRLRLVTREADAPAPIVVGEGDASRLGDILPYAVDRAVVALRENGSRRFAWTAPARVLALGAGGGELAVSTDGGLVTVLDGSGRVVRTETFDSDATSVRITGDGLLVQRGNRLELRDGGPPRSWRIPQLSLLQDASGDRVVYVHRGELRRLRTSSSSDRSLGQGSLAQLEGSTLDVASGLHVTARTLR